MQALKADSGFLRAPASCLQKFWMSTLKNDGLARLQRENDAIWHGKMEHLVEIFCGPSALKAK
jgi:hypothetical protein